MDPTFTFPRLKPAIPRPQAPLASQGESRESNALRASVLDAALELGLANNSVVADWMFNNTLKEEEEEEEVEEPVPSPGLTNGSSATSEESSSYSHPPPPVPVSNSIPFFISDTRDPQFPKHLGARAAIVPSAVDVPYIIPVAAGSNATFPEVPFQIPPRPPTPSGRTKLKKKNRGDGYESDGGYVSEAGRKKDKDKKKEKEGDDEKKEMKARMKEEKKEKEEERKRKKSLVSAVTRSSSKDKEKDKDSGYATGYETDGSKRSKSKSKKVKPQASLGNIGGEYETDVASTPLKKSKSRFFKLSTKSSKPNLQEDVVVPSPSMEKEREKEVVPLPIAGRFTASAGAPPVPYIPPPINPSPVLSPGASLASSLTLPPPERLPPIATHALDLDSVTSSVVSSPVSAVTSPSVLSAVKKQADRDSHSSASSGSSGGSFPQRRGTQFSPTHANGRDSYSTITSTSQSHSHSHGHGPPPSSMVYSPPGSGSAQGHLKPPSISFPVTRSPSPHTPFSPVAPLNVVKGLKTKASLDAIHPNHCANSSNGVSSISLSPDSPYVMVTPTSTTSSSSSSPYPPNNITSPIIPPLRPRNPPTNGFGPRLAPIQTQIQTQNLGPPPHVHFPFAAHEKPTHTHLNIVPSEDWVVPSPSAQTSHVNVITPPSVLAYYDIPPPSPPPMGPLPVPPVEQGGGGGGGGTSAGVFPTMSQLRARIHERGANREFTQLMPNGNGNGNNMQRGRELPFPARPIMLPTSNSSNTTSSSANPNSNLNGNSGVGLEVGVNVRRYRDLYAPPAGGWPEPQPQRRPPHQLLRSDEGEGYEGEEEEEEEDMKDVLDRFEVDSNDSNDHSNSDAAEFMHMAHPTREPRRRSFEAIINPKPGHESFAVSEYYGSRDTVYSFADADAGDRSSRWSGGSVYSRNSILDMDKSEEARERFLERVGAMLGGGDDEDEDVEEKRGGGGRGRGQGQGVVVVPPVPNIPERFASPRRNWPPPGKF